MPKISIRIDDGTYNKIEAHRGNITQADFYRQIIDSYLRQFDDKTTPNDSSSTTNDALLIANKEEIEHLRQENLRLLELLHESQVLQLQTQRLLTDSNTKSKLWWQFWKK